MTPGRAEQIIATLDGIESPEHRAVYLVAACENEPELRERVEAMIRLRDAVDRGPEPAVSGDVTRTMAVPTGERLGSIIANRYKLLEEIGEGGMGTVWVAEQARPIRRKVAVKLIKAGMDSKSVLGHKSWVYAVAFSPNDETLVSGGVDGLLHEWEAGPLPVSK